MWLLPDEIFFMLIYLLTNVKKVGTSGEFLLGTLHNWVGNVIQIKYGLPYCVTCPSMSTDPGSLNPGMRRSRIPGWWDPGIRTNTGAGDTVLAKHT